jgi:hypothetical protein
MPGWLVTMLHHVSWYHSLTPCWLVTLCYAMLTDNATPCQLVTHYARLTGYNATPCQLVPHCCIMLTGNTVLSCWLAACVTSHKNWIFSSSTVRTSNLIKLCLWLIKYHTMKACGWVEVSSTHVNVSTREMEVSSYLHAPPLLLPGCVVPSTSLMLCRREHSQTEFTGYAACGLASVLSRWLSNSWM